MRKLIGLSVSFCVKDICQGKIPLEAVAGVVPGFNFDSKDAVFSRYKDVYWREFPERAREVLEALVILPPHKGGQNLSAGYWMRESDYSPQLVLNYSATDFSVRHQDQDLNDHLKMTVGVAAAYATGEIHPELLPH